MKRYLTFVTAFFVSLSVYCQSADWLVVPNKYSEISFFAPNMYKVTENEKIGIINSKGKVLVPAQYDAINLFYEGRTIFVNYTSRGIKVMGVLSEDGKAYYTNDDFYVFNDYMYYSEGFLPVKDSEGRYGYLNEQARPAFEFIDEEVKPFSEGRAVVGSGETFCWITPDGSKILPRLKNGEYPYGGTNFSDGTAYTWDESGDVMILNSDGTSEKARIDINQLQVDYMFRSDTEYGLEVPYSKYSETFDDVWHPEVSNGKWSYMSDSGKLLMPFQFETAEPFSDGVAIASTDGKYGLLHLVADKSVFYTRASNKAMVFSKGSSCNCEFQLSIPEKWKNQEVTVIVKDPETNEVISINKVGKNDYSFSYKPDASRNQDEKKFNVEVNNNGVKLWTGEQVFNFIQRVKLAARLSVNNAVANSNDMCTVTAVVKNPSSIPVTTKVTLSGGGTNAQFNGKTVTITIPPYSSRTVSSSFLVKKVVLNGWCEVSTSDGAGQRRSNLQFKPFF